MSTASHAAAEQEGLLRDCDESGILVEQALVIKLHVTTQHDQASNNKVEITAVYERLLS